MSAVDRVLNQMKGKHQEGPDFPPDCIARFLCTKSSWRGKYRRIICITPTSVVTQYPDSQAVTNTWPFVGDSDIDGVGVTAADAEEPEFVLSARTDKRVAGPAPDNMCILCLLSQPEHLVYVFKAAERFPCPGSQISLLELGALRL